MIFAGPAADCLMYMAPPDSTLGEKIGIVEFQPLILLYFVGMSHIPCSALLMEPPVLCRHLLTDMEGIYGQVLRARRICSDVEEYFMRVYNGGLTTVRSNLQHRLQAGGIARG